MALQNRAGSARLWLSRLTLLSLKQYPGEDRVSLTLRKGTTMSIPFRTSLIHLVVPTNIPGAFSCPAIPDELDMVSATSATLAKHGVYWRKPQPGDPPLKAEAWSQHLGIGWSVAKCIIPQMKPIPGKTHLPIRRSLPGTLRMRSPTGLAAACSGRGRMQPDRGLFRPLANRMSHQEVMEGGIRRRG